MNIKRRIQSQFENAQNGACAAMVILAGFAFACSAGSQAPTAPSPQPAASATYSLSGTITEAAPTATVPIAGAAVTIGDGPNAGRSATTDSRGVYTISGLQRSGFTINASANGFQPSAKGLTLLADNALDFALSPTPAILSDAQTQRFTDNVGATGCLDVNRRPCFRTTYPVHNAGRFDARLVWTDYTNSAAFQGLFSDWVSIHLLKDGATIASASTSARYPHTGDNAASIGVEVGAGSMYTVEIAYYSYVLARNRVTVTVTVQRPN